MTLLQSLLQLASQIFAQFIATPALLSAVITGITALISVTWFVASNVRKRIMRRWGARWEIHKVALGPRMTRQRYQEISQQVSGFHCLIVRYGTDDYMSKIASDDEREVGRLQNKVRPVELKFDEQGEGILVLKLRVHKRLGTQFKCFVVVPQMANMDQIMTRIRECNHVVDVQISHSQFRDRIYFLIDKFFRATTVEGITTNVVFPE